MTKEKFISTLAALYRVGNRGDVNASEKPADEANWTHHSMAHDVCHRLDLILQSLEKNGIIDADEMQSFYDEL